MDGRQAPVVDAVGGLEHLDRRGERARVVGRRQAELTIASNKQRNQKLSIFEKAREAAQRTPSI